MMPDNGSIPQTQTNVDPNVEASRQPPAGSSLEDVLFEAAPIGLGLSNLQGQLVRYNKHLLEVSGFTPKEIEDLGSVTALYYHPEDRQKILEKVKEQGFVDEYPVLFKKKDGGYFESLLSLRPVSIGGQPHFLALVQDVTEQNKTRRELEVKLRQLSTLNKAMLGREAKMAELKDQIQEQENS